MENITIQDRGILLMPDEKIKNVEVLSSLLLNSYVLCLKTFNCMWNIKMHLHEQKVLKEQFTDLEMAVNEISDRIKDLGYEVPRDFDQISRLSEINFDRSETRIVFEDILKQNDHLSEFIRNSIPGIRRSNDDRTYDLLLKRQNIHERNSILLREIIPIEV